MTPRNLHQQPLYLEHHDADDLDALASETSKTKQVLLREAVTDLFVKYRGQGYLQPRLTDSVLNEGTLGREVAREIRTGASINIDALVESGELIPRGRSWYAFSHVNVLGKVNQIANEFGTRKFRGKAEMQVKLRASDVKKYKKMAARLRRDV